MVVSCGRSLGGDYSNNQIANIHLQNHRFKIRKDAHPGVNLNWLTDYMQLEELFRKVVREEVDHAIRLHTQSLTSSLPKEAKQSVSRSFRLQFIGTLPSRVFTGNKIEAEGPDGALPLKVVLLDANSGAVITDGLFSSMKLEAIVLQGDFKAEEQMDWTEKEFNENVAVEREGRRPLLIGDRVITLTKGEAVLEGLSFTDNSSWVRSGKFRVAVKAVKGLLPPDMGVQEAVSGAFEVRDRRGEPYQKRARPSLEDKVWRLHKIAKDGQHAGKLAAKGIYTVKDFLQQYYIDKFLLLDILKVSKRAWDLIVSHAKSCLLSNEHYTYFNDTVGVGLLFNCVLDLVGVTYDGQTYQPLDTLDESRKLQAEKLRCFAYEDRSKLVPTNIAANWATMPPEPVVPSVGSSLNLHCLDVQDLDQDKSETLLDSDLSQSSLPCPYEAEEEYTNHHLSKLMGCDQPMQVPSLLVNDGSSLFNDYIVGICSDQHKWAHNLLMDESCPTCPFLGGDGNSNNNMFQTQTSTWYSVAPNSAAAAGNGSSVASTSNSHITLFSPSTDFSVNFPGGYEVSKSGWSKA